MTRIEGPTTTVRTSIGTVTAPMFGEEVVGDRLLASPIEVDLPGADGQPRLEMLIEVIEGVPRCTELTLRRTEGGREIRPRDLRAIELENFVETFVALVASEIVERDGGSISAVVRGDEASVRGGMKTVRAARRGSRRPMTDERRKRVAHVYNAQEAGGIEAVELAFQVSRSTAIRYINAARDAGLIQGKTK